VPGTDLYTYPDVTVACEPPEYDDDQRDTLLNPTLLIEVLSPSTEVYDRGAKFAHYRRLPSLREFWSVSTNYPLVERYVRDGELWVLHEYAGLEAVLPLTVANACLTLADAYSRVEFPSAPGQ
jgi:Uma2 family endonuclease